MIFTSPSASDQSMTYWTITLEREGAAIVLDLGETGVWWGIVVGNILGSTFGYGWARVSIARLTSRQENP
jgi:Na+-driven multidrug efflux pump